ncbi:hypothetical protein EV702DRAFT_1047330 [Suillus placidus]|uniref:Uncharacterized protein n=1 Tax=Suillus placidus TaxID=48579 RepID=A0A9P6ZQU1_9AGAM|nr:hypothetical protein EV702DRAFT_1047330 [Suillus placidus]
MTTPTASFQAISYNPVNPKRRLTPSERSSHCLQPYARSMSDTMQHESSSIASGSLVSDNCGGQKKPKKLALCNLDPDEHVAIKWARKRLVMDLLTTVVWPQNETDEEKDTYLNEIVNQANSMFGTKLVLTKELAALMNTAVMQFRSSLAEISEQLGREFDIEPKDTSLTSEACKAHMQNCRVVLLDSSEGNQWRYFLHGEKVEGEHIILLVFSNRTVEKIHLLHLYSSTYMPLRDQEFLKEITTTLNMFSHIAAGVECGIDRIVDGAPSGSGRVVRFVGERYALRQVYYKEAITRAMLLPIHKDTLLGAVIKSSSKRTDVGSQFCSKVMREKMGLTAPEHPIYVPQTMQELTRPLYPGTASEPPLQSSSAALQMPVQAEPLHSYTGYLTGDSHTSPAYYYGSTSDSQSGPYYEPPDEDENMVKETQELLSKLHGYSFY